MKRNHWQKSKTTLGGLKAVQHIDTKEIALILQYGQIWEDGNNYKALIDNPYIANKLCKKLSIAGGYKKGDEAVIRISAANLKVVIQFLVPIKYQKWQLHKGNAFGLPGGMGKSPTEIALESIIQHQSDQIIDQGPDIAKAIEKREALERKEKLPDLTQEPALQNKEDG